jgi:hypothetical protein
MMLVYQNGPIFIHGFNHKLGSIQRNLQELEGENLLVGSIDNLSAVGYRHNFALAKDESLLGLASTPLSVALRIAPKPRALISQHCYAESAVLACAVDEVDIAMRNRYFAAELMRKLQVDDVPYFCSFASGCTGFISILAAAGGLFTSSDDGSAICLVADSLPPGVPYDMARERILGSDHSSAFVIGREQHGYQLLGINYYSTTRTTVPFVEIVKRTVQMIQELATILQLDLAKSDVAIHYPNIFPDTWKMVTRHLRLQRAEHVVDGMAERGHCMASDAVISLAKLHHGWSGRLHVVVNYGIGLHLGLCILKEQETNGQKIRQV